MLTVVQAATRASRDPETIRRWIRAGKLTAWKVGTQHVIDEDDLSDAIRGIFATPAAGTEPAAAARDRAIVSAIHRNRAERSHQIQEAIAPYLPSTSSAPTGAPPMLDVWLTHIVGRVVRAMDPVRIILFGSRARGDQRPDSDYDLLVVMEQLTDRRATRLDVRRSYDRLPVSSDVIVATVAETDGSVPDRPAGAVYWALKEGRVLYDRDDVV